MYKFEKISEDVYKLTTDKGEHMIMRDIDLIKEIQSVDIYTTMIVADFLAERGETYDNTKLRITRTEGNKTTIDESNLQRIEEKARNQAYYNVLNKIFNKTCGIGYLDVVSECGLKSNDEVDKFITEFTNIITQGIDNSPRDEDTQGDRAEQ